MKNFLIVILIAGAATLGALYYQQGQRLKKQGEEVASLKEKVESLESSLSHKEKTAETTRKQLRSTSTELTQKAAEAEKKAAEAEKAVAEGNKGADALNQLVKNPQTREMMKSSQAMVIDSMLPNMYGSLFSTLPPEQAEKLKAILKDRMLSQAQMGLELMAADNGPEKTAEIEKEIKEKSDAMTQQIKELLGADGFKQFEQYEKSLPDRMQLNAVRDQFAQSGTPLSDQQQADLLNVLYDERSKYPFQVDLSNQNRGLRDLTEENVNAYFRDLAALQERQLARAQSLLTPEQFEAFKKAQQGQFQMQKASLTLAASMFKKPAAK